MPECYIIGVDIGTTSTKSVLFKEDGTIVSQHQIAYPLYSPTAAIAEQNPDEIYAAVIGTIKAAVSRSGVSPAHIGCVSFSSAMHSLIAVDGSGAPLTASITWADNRSLAWAVKLKEEWGGNGIYARTGTPIHPMSPLSKLIWLRNEHEELFRRTYKFVSIKEYIWHKLFNRWVVDYSIATATGLFHLEKLAWDEEALTVAGIQAERLSAPVPTTYTWRGLDDRQASELGLLPDTPFVIGASDGVLSNLGVGAIHEGTAALTIGTSGAIRAVVSRPATDPLGRTFCYALTEDRFAIGGAVNNGGIVLRWLRDMFSTDNADSADGYDELTALAASVKPGADGLLFHPYLAGERAPLWDGDARGSYYGLGLHHGKGHLVRAAMEGVLLNLREVLDVLEELNGRPSRIIATGGFARSGLWRQMAADIFNREVLYPQSMESSCLGAAMLGLYSIGRLETLEAAARLIGKCDACVPIKEHAGRYEELLAIYKAVGSKLKDEHGAIAALQRRWSEPL